MPLTSHPLLSQHFDSNEVAFAKIDEEVAALQESIRTLYVFRNTFTPTYRIPPEILTRIFFLVRQQSNESISYDRSPSLRWILVSHVSQHWRDVAISIPTLWSNISNSPDDAMSLWLQRSKAVPLSVDLYHPSSTQVQQFIHLQLPRIRVLSLKLTSESWDALSSQFASPAPILESLSITITGRVVVPSNVAISDALFAGTTPHLQRLTVSTCGIDLNSSICRGLTKLELRKIPDGILPTALLVAIRRMPYLTSLILVGVFHGNAPPIPADFDIISLSSLECLEIEGYFFFPELQVLSRLSFPPSTTLRFGSYDWAEGNPVTALTKFLRAQHAARHQVLSPRTPPLLKMDLQCARDAFRLMLTRDEDDEDPSTIPIMEVDLAGDWGNSLDLPDLPEVVDMCSLLPLQSLTSIKVNCRIDVEIWMTVFGRLPHLKRITACGFDAIHVLEAIITDFKKQQSRSSKRGRGRKGRGGRGGGTSIQPPLSLIFPNLDGLDIQQAPLPNWKDLVAALSGRKTAGKPIKAFGIYRCLGMEKDMVRAVSRAVDSVIWDGKLVINADEEDEEHDDNMVDDRDPLTLWLQGL